MKKNALTYRQYKDADEAIAEVDTSVILTPVTHMPYDEIDTTQLREKIEKGDSLIKLNDTLYSVFTVPEFMFLNPYNINEQTGLILLKSKQLYLKARQMRQSANSVNLTREITRIVKKYTYKDVVDYSYDDAENEYAKDFHKHFRNKYDIPKIDQEINNVAERKSRWSSSKLPALFRSFFYFAFAITLLVFTFRHSTVRTYFISLLAAFILYLLTFLIGLLFNQSVGFYFIWVFFCFAASIIAATFVFQNKQRVFVTGIGINIFVMMVAFMPMTLVGYINAIGKHQYADGRYKPMFDYYVHAEILGIVGFLILLPTYIYRLYRKWYALPED